VVLDSIAPRLPYRVVPAVIVQLPGDQPSVPIRSRPAKLNESLHLGYAIQWFCFAAISLGGLALAFRRRQSPGP
jgi:cytochrome oxidase assembly protein ShyY1